MALEDSVSVGIAWLIGILLDVLGGTVFGEHALVMCLCVFIFIKLKKANSLVFHCHSRQL